MSVTSARNYCADAAIVRDVVMAKHPEEAVNLLILRAANG
jgi:hypothetical protein